MVLIENPVSPSGRLLSLRRCETLVKRGQLEFVVPGKRARMTGHRHQSAELSEAQKSGLSASWYDGCKHRGNWFVIQPFAGRAMPSQLIMPHPRQREA